MATEGSLKKSRVFFMALYVFLALIVIGESISVGALRYIYNTATTLVHGGHPCPSCGCPAYSARYVPGIPRLEDKLLPLDTPYALRKSLEAEREAEKRARYLFFCPACAPDVIKGEGGIMESVLAFPINIIGGLIFNFGLPVFTLGLGFWSELKNGKRLWPFYGGREDRKGYLLIILMSMLISIFFHAGLIGKFFNI